jgi:hypothetical protein
MHPALVRLLSGLPADTSVHGSSLHVSALTRSTLRLDYEKIPPRLRADQALKSKFGLIPTAKYNLPPCVHGVE